MAESAINSVESSLLSEMVTSPENSDDSLALKFVSEQRDTLRFTAELGKYYYWTTTSGSGGCWRQDKVLKVYDGIRQLCRVSSMLTDSQFKQIKLCSASTVTSVERLARSDQRISMTVDQWDSHNMMLNTPLGIVDLDNGQMRSATPVDYCTKITSVGPKANRPELWEKCLATWTDGDSELQSYLKRVCGYCLTGETREHLFFFLHGSGRNGKSVFLNTLSGILNDYAKTAPTEVFTVSRGDRHPAGCAHLVGCRVATATEIEAKSQWAEAQIQAMTGGDVISTRYMRQDFFDFRPQFKLMIAGNHRPNLSGVNEAMRSRLRLLPFEVIIPPESRDTQLPVKLRAEWPAILNWMIEGCIEWQKDGLGPNNTPACVMDKTNDYLSEQDVLGQWITECCVTNPNVLSKGVALYKSWKDWCTEREQFVTSQKSFIGALKDRPNIRHEHKRDGNHLAGIALAADGPSGF